MSSKFAPDVPKSLIDAVSSILGEAKVEPAKPDPEAVARKKKLDALRDKQEADKAEKGEDKPQGIRKVAGTAYGGAKQKHEPEIEEELKGNQHKIDANKNGKIDAHDFKILRGKKKVSEESEELDERELTAGESEKKEKYVKSMKKGLAGFKARYGSKAKNVMYATATKLAKNEETVTEAIVNHEDIAKHLIKKHGKDVSMDHIEDAIDGMDDAHKVDKREVLHHVKKLTKEEVELDEGRMKDLAYDLDNMGHSEFHKTYGNPKSHYDPKNFKKPVEPGKEMDRAKALAQRGLKSVKKEETVIEGTGGPIYPKPFVKLGDLLARAKDMRNIKQATIVTPKAENEVVLKKEETEQVDETMMGKAGCTSEDDKKKAEAPVDYDKPTFLRKKDDWRKSNPAHLPKPTKEDVELDERVITPGTGTSPDPLKARTGLNAVLRKPRAGQTNLRNIPAGNLPGSRLKFSDDDKTRQRTLLKTAIKSTLANKEHGKSKLPEEVSIDETAVLDKYIKAMGYDPEHLDKNKKVMFAKTNAYKTYAASQKSEALYDGGQKGTQDIDVHMSPGVTARGK